jgi:hypothetical protein
LSYICLSPSDIGIGATAARLKFDTGSNVANEYAYYDGIRIYEITQAQYAALGSMMPELIASKYPYVDSVQPVRNPYAIRYGENLLPPFYEWESTAPLAGRPVIINPYEYTVTASANTAGLKVVIPCAPKTDYVLNSSGDGMMALQDLDSSRTLINNNGGYQDVTSLSIRTSSNAAFLSIILGVGTKGAGIYTFKNPMLTIGSTPKPFKPREDSMLALQTDLYAHPLIGANADEVFEKDGQYFKLKKFNRIVFDDKITFNAGSKQAAGLQRVQMTLPSAGIGGASGPQYGTKYDGKIMPVDANGTVADSVYLNSNGVSLTFVISSTDSGWGDNYTPTADEIRAYFMGWTMSVSGQPRTVPYNGTGSKVWIKTTMVNNPNTPMVVGDYVGAVPTENAGADSKGLSYPPYQLVYQLATPTVEPIVSEGMLTFHEGDNQIEVGTGIVLRESVKPYNEVRDTGNRKYNINNGAWPVPASHFINKAHSVLAVYREGKYDPQWIMYPYSTTALGAMAQLLNVQQEDERYSYSATYLMWDKSPVVPFTGSYAANEKAMFQELTDAVQQNATAVSVLRNKKAEKELSSGWITPTLLNGWVTAQWDSFPDIPMYTKDSAGSVYIRGMVKGGTTGYNVPIFILPEGYRPKQIVRTYVYGNSNGLNPCVIYVRPDGLVVCTVGHSGAVSMDITPYLAEQ